MKRTKYFTNTIAGTLKRIRNGVIEYYSRYENKPRWRPSAYRLHQLDAAPFKRITREQARKLVGVSIR